MTDNFDFSMCTANAGVDCNAPGYHGLFVQRSPNGGCVELAKWEDDGTVPRAFPTWTESANGVTMTLADLDPPSVAACGDKNATLTVAFVCTPAVDGPSYNFSVTLDAPCAWSFSFPTKYACSS
jgi:hypothetical protein